MIARFVLLVALIMLGGCAVHSAHPGGSQPHLAPAKVRLTYVVTDPRYNPQGEWQRDIRRGKGGALASFTLRARDVLPKDIPLVEAEAAKYRAQCFLGVAHEEMRDDARPNPAVYRDKPLVLLGRAADQALTLVQVTYRLQCVRPSR